MENLLEILNNGLPLAAAFDSVRSILLGIGVVTFIAGVFLMMYHKGTYDRIELEQPDERTRLFEKRKFRRRTMVGSLLAAMGVIMAALHWAIEPMVFTILISLILILIIAILGLATLDMLSISLHGLSQADEDARQALVDAYLEQRKKKAAMDQENGNTDQENTDQASSDQTSSGDSEPTANSS